MTGLRQLSIPTAATQKRLMANTAAEAVYNHVSISPGHMDDAEKEPRALISGLQTTTHKGFLLSASSTVCALFVQLSMSTVLLNSCTVLFFLFFIFCGARDTLKLRRDAGVEGTAGNELENCIDNVMSTCQVGQIICEMQSWNRRKSPCFGSCPTETV